MFTREDDGKHNLNIVSWVKSGF